MSEITSPTAPPEPVAPPAAVTEPAPGGTPTPAVDNPAPSAQPPADPNQPAATPPAQDPAKPTAPAVDPLQAQAYAELQQRYAALEQRVQQMGQPQPGQQQPPQQQEAPQLITGDNANAFHVKALTENPIPEQVIAGLQNAENPQAFKQSVHALAAHIATIASRSAEHNLGITAHALTQWTQGQMKGLMTPEGMQQQAAQQQQVEAARTAFFAKYPHLSNAQLEPLLEATAAKVMQETGVKTWSEAVGDEVAKRMATVVNPALTKQAGQFNATNGGARPNGATAAGNPATANTHGFDGAMGAIVSKGGF